MCGSSSNRKQREGGWGERIKFRLTVHRSCVARWHDFFPRALQVGIVALLFKRGRKTKRLDR